jgi:hypothetical protein
VQSFHAETIVKKDGEVHLKHLPFAAGQSVHVFVSPSTNAAQQSLKGTVLKYDQPFAPVSEQDWEANT